MDLEFYQQDKWALFVIAVGMAYPGNVVIPPTEFVFIDPGAADFLNGQWRRRFLRIIGVGEKSVNEIPHQNGVGKQKFIAGVLLGHRLDWLNLFWKHIGPPWFDLFKIFRSEDLASEGVNTL